MWYLFCGTVTCFTPALLCFWFLSFCLSELTDSVISCCQFTHMILQRNSVKLSKRYYGERRTQGYGALLANICSFCFLVQVDKDLKKKRCLIPGVECQTPDLNTTDCIFRKDRSAVAEFSQNLFPNFVALYSWPDTLTAQQFPKQLLTSFPT